ncbi:unnamed protein product, partial [Effrenium voratum]
MEPGVVPLSRLARFEGGGRDVGASALAPFSRARRALLPRAKDGDASMKETRLDGEWQPFRRHESLAPRILRLPIPPKGSSVASEPGRVIQRKRELRAQLEDERRSRQVQEAAAVEAINNVTAQMRKRREVETELTSTRSKLQKVLDELAAEKLEVKDLKGSLQTQGTGPLTVWLLSSHWQWTIASLAAAVGAFGV